MTNSCKIINTIRPNNFKLFQKKYVPKIRNLLSRSVQSCPRQVFFFKFQTTVEILLRGGGGESNAHVQDHGEHIKLRGTGTEVRLLKVTGNAK